MTGARAGFRFPFCFGFCFVAASSRALAIVSRAVHEEVLGRLGAPFACLGRLTIRPGVRLTKVDVSGFSKIISILHTVA
jgi:hypothetical protein